MNKNNVLEEHPTGVTSAVTAALLMLVEKFTSVDFSSYESVLILAAVTGVASLFSPRFRKN